MKHGSAKGIASCIKESFQAINIMEESFEKKLVGFPADGASVNRGEKEGVIVILKGRQPWVIYVWCVAHCLELSLKDALQGTVFHDVDEVLLRLYYLYEENENGEEDVEFVDNYVAALLDHFREPLLKAGLDVALNSLLEQWHDLVAYATRCLDPSRTHYLRVWKRIFDSSRKDRWNMVLLSVELLLSIPISNAKVEGMFSLTNRVKTDFRASLSENPLNNLIRIQMEGPPLEEFDPTPAIQLWAMGATRRLNQRERKHYSARESKNRRKVLINASSTEESSGTDSEEDFEREDKDEGGKVLIAELDELE